MEYQGDYKDQISYSEIFKEKPKITTFNLA